MRATTSERGIYHYGAARSTKRYCGHAEKHPEPLTSAMQDEPAPDTIMVVVVRGDRRIAGCNQFGFKRQRRHRPAQRPTSHPHFFRLRYRVASATSTLPR